MRHARAATFSVCIALLAQGSFAMSADDKPEDKVKAPAESTPAETEANAPRDFDKLWNYRDPAATFAKFEALLPAARQANKPGYLAELLSQIARTHGLRQDFKTAHTVLDEAKSLLGDAPQEHGVAWARVLLERGRAHNSNKEKDVAIVLFRQALDVAKVAQSDFHAVDAAHMLGIACPPEEALAWNVKAIDLAEASSSHRAKKWLGALYNNTGWTYFGKKDWPKALDYFQRNQTYCRANGRHDGIATWSVAKTYRMMGRLEEALAIQRELEVRYVKEERPDGYVFEELAECLLALGKKDEAKPYFAKAYAKLSPDAWLQRDEPERLERLRTLGGIPAPQPEEGEGTE